MRGIERIGGFGGKSDILAHQRDLSRATPHAYKERLRRLGEATVADVRDAARDWLSRWRVCAGSRSVRGHKQIETPAERSAIPDAGRAARSEAARLSTKSGCPTA